MFNLANPRLVLASFLVFAAAIQRRDSGVNTRANERVKHLYVKECLLEAPTPEPVGGDVQTSCAVRRRAPATKVLTCQRLE